MKQTLGLIASLAYSSLACSGPSTVLDRSALRVSKNSRIVAENVIPNAERYRNVVEHLGLAQEVYQSQMTMLKSRKSQLRSRSRTFSVLSYGTFVLTTLGVGIAAIAVRDNPGSAIQGAGYGALGGAAAGTLFQFAGYLQEDPSSVDGKLRRLENSYTGMLERIRSLAGAPPGQDMAGLIGSSMAQAIESFITQAVEIDVKG